MSDATARIMRLPTGYDPLIAPWVWAIEDTRRRTKQAIAGLSPIALDRPAPAGGNSIATILYHLVVIEMSYLYEDILGLAWAPELDRLLPYEVRGDHGRLTPIQGEDLTTHLWRLDESRTLLLGHLQQINAVEWRRPRQVGDYTITPEWAIHHLIQHEAEHRGQIGELRRDTVTW